MSPKSLHSCKSTSSTISSTISSGSDHEFKKPQEKLPSKFRTQAQTSSSSGSVSTEWKSQSQSVYYKRSEAEYISGSQDLFSKEDHGEDENSPEFHSSTPFVNGDQKKVFNSLQLSGEFVSSISTSPTALGKFNLTTSSSSDEDRKKMNVEIPHEQEHIEQTLDVPAWCKQDDIQYEETGKSDEKESENSLLDDSNVSHASAGNTADMKYPVVGDSQQFDKITKTQTDELSNISISIGDDNNLKTSDAHEDPSAQSTGGNLVMSGTDIFNPVDSEAIDTGVMTKMASQQCETEESQTMLDMNFKLSQDFSQVKLKFVLFLNVVDYNVCSIKKFNG